jgi:hypothetical protein
LPDDEKEVLPPLENAFFSAPHDVTLFSVDPDAELDGADGRGDGAAIMTGSRSRESNVLSPFQFVGVNFDLPPLRFGATYSQLRR